MTGVARSVRALRTSNGFRQQMLLDESPNIGERAAVINSPPQFPHIFCNEHAALTLEPTKTKNRGDCSMHRLGAVIGIAIVGAALSTHLKHEKSARFLSRDGPLVPTPTM